MLSSNIWTEYCSIHIQIHLFTLKIFCITKKRPLTSKTTPISNNGSHVRVVSIERQIVTIVVTYWADCQLCCHFGYRHCMNEQT